MIGKEYLTTFATLGAYAVFVALAAIESIIAITWGTAPVPLSKQQVRAIGPHEPAGCVAVTRLVLSSAVVALRQGGGFGTL